MRELSNGVLLESKYPGVRLGAIVGSEGLALIDSPIRTEDGREWLNGLSALGRPRYLVALDHHPDRVLGARGLEIPLVAHDHTRQVMSGWPDVFKGGAAPIGAEADRLKRVTGMRKAVPEVTFSEEMSLLLGSRTVRLIHRPGPTPGSIWAEVEGTRVIFIGDAVTASEPPYVGDADLEAWERTLEEARRLAQRGQVLIGSRDGRVRADEVAAMLRFLRKIPNRLEKLARRAHPEGPAASMAAGLLEGFRVTQGRREQAVIRLQAGLIRLCARLHPEGD